MRYPHLSDFRPHLTIPIVSLHTSSFLPLPRLVACVVPPRKGLVRLLIFLKKSSRSGLDDALWCLPTPSSISLQDAELFLYA